MSTRICDVERLVKKSIQKVDQSIKDTKYQTDEKLGKIDNRLSEVERNTSANGLSPALTATTDHSLGLNQSDMKAIVTEISNQMKADLKEHFKAGPVQK